MDEANLCLQLVHNAGVKGRKFVFGLNAVIAPLSTTSKTTPTQAPSSENLAPVDRPITPRPQRLGQVKGRNILWVSIPFAVALLVGVGLWNRQRRIARRDVTPFTVETRSGSLPGVVSATGEVSAMKRVNVSPTRQGQLIELYVDEGDRVVKDQPIARMDAGTLIDKIQEAEANLRSAKAEQRRSASELRRNHPLYREGAISFDDLERFRAEDEVRRMAVNAAMERLQQRQVEAKDLIVRAPFEGVITQRFAEPGSFVTPTTSASSTAGASSSSIVELSDGKEVLAKVPESDLGRLTSGMPAKVRVESFPDRSYSARIRAIAPRAKNENNVTSFEVKLQLVQPATELRIGMTADVDVQAGEIQADMILPTVAVVTENGQPGVLLVGDRQEPTFQPVELGVSSGEDSQILSGINSGDRVFIDLPPWSKQRD